MTNTSGSVLVAEIGSHTTRVTLIDTVEGEARMIGRAEVPSTIEPPRRNGLFGVLAATAQLAEMTGRKLLHDGQLLMPQNNERDGINQVVAMTSAAGTLDLVVTAIASNVSARSALHACRGTYTTILQVVTLDDAMMRTNDNGSDSWIVRQIQSMLALSADATIIAGGVEGGAVEPLTRLAHIVGLTALRTSTDVSGQQSQKVMARPVIFAGNSTAREQVLEVLSGRAEMQVVDNVRPTLEHEHLESARQAINRLYDERVLTRLPGLADLRRVSHAPVTTVCHVEGLMTRFIAERNQRSVLTVDIGSTNSSAFLASQGDYTLAVLGNCGTGYGLTTVLKERGIAAIARWLPFSLSETELTHRLLNKVLRPHTLPASPEDALIEQAVTREALAMVFETLSDERLHSVYDLVVAGGGVLTHVPHAGVAALMLLDALQPRNESDQWVLDLRLDMLGMLPVCGALAALNPDMAVTVFEQDFLRSMPLATCIVPIGEGRIGEVALEAELRMVGGGRQQITVRHGQIVRLPLPQGAYGQLILQPAAGIRIGDNEPGQKTESNAAEMKGSALGIIIDARGRPLQLSTDAVECQARMREWLAALGSEHDQIFVSVPSAAVKPAEQDHAELPSPLADISIQNDIEEVPLPEPALERSTLLEPDIQPAIQEVPLPEPALEHSTPPLADVPLPEALSAPAELIGIEAEVVAVETPTARIKPGSRISLSDLAAQEQAVTPEPRATEATHSQAEPEMTGIESDLAKLRQSVEQPKKRGWFGRKPKE